MPYKKGFALYNKAAKENEREKLFEIWLVNFSKMDKETYISFEAWIKKLEEAAEVERRMASRSKKDIVSLVNDIRIRAGKVKVGEH